LDRKLDGAKAHLGRFLFRTWTALAVLAGYLYNWVYHPEALTWWKRSTTTAIEWACGLLPYPWGDRIEASIGDFGLWIQITLAILGFRLLVWLILLAYRSRPNRRAAGSPQ
jgi:hypothetical protein